MRSRIHGTLILWIIIFTISACTLSSGEDGVKPTITRPGENPTPRPLEATAPPTLTLAPIDTPTPTITQTPSLTPTPTDTETPAPTPTYAILRGKVIPERLSCRYGPGVDYLFKFSVFGNIEILGRMERSSWILVQAIGGKNSCWVNGDYVEINGDIMSVAPKDPHIVLPWSPYYGPLTGVSATRVWGYSHSLLD